MTPEQLGRRIRTSQRLSDRTLAIWCYALNYIFEHGWTDITDEAFIKSGKEQFKASSQSMIAHLRRMKKVGLLKGYRLVEHPDSFSLDETKTPRTFIRYTMPGMNAQSLDSRMKDFAHRRGHDYTPAENRMWAKKFAKLGPKS